MTLTQTNSSKTFASNWQIADSGAVRGLASAPEKPAEWIASKSTPWGFSAASSTSAFSLFSYSFNIKKEL